MKYLGIKSQINLKTIKQSLFSSPFNNSLFLNSSRNTNKEENFTITKRKKLLYKSNSTDKLKLPFQNKNNFYKVHYYTIKVNDSNSEEKDENKNSYYPFIKNKEIHFLNKFRQTLKFKKKKNKNLSVDKLLNLVSERKLKYLSPKENDFKSIHEYLTISKIKINKKFNFFNNYSYNEKRNNIFNQNPFDKEFFKKKLSNNIFDFTNLNRFNSYREEKKKIQKKNSGWLFQNEQIRKVLRSPENKDKSMEIYSIFFNNKKH